jgi:hypothetical protein
MVCWSKKGSLAVSLTIAVSAWFVFAIVFDRFANVVMSNWLVVDFFGGNIMSADSAGVTLYFDTIELVVLSGALIFGFWIAFKILHATASRMVMAGAVIGASLTLLSLLDTTRTYVSYLDPYPAYVSGLPLNWFAIGSFGIGLQTGIGFFSFFLLIDVMFWVALAYTGLLLSSRLLRMRHHPAHQGLNPSAQVLS